MTTNSIGATVVQGPRVDLKPSTHADEVATGGTVLFRAYVDGRWVGWVGDSRKWRGHRYGARKWWACHREDGDQYARRRADGLGSRRAAVAWLGQEAAR